MKKIFKQFTVLAITLALTAPITLAQDSESGKKNNTAKVNTSVRMVGVNGHLMRILTAGWDRMQAGQPIVVFESGLGGGLDVWRTVVSEVAAFAPVVAYDRAGLGQTPPDGERPTPEHVNKRLHALLDEIGARPPYVLVGHSWGGPLIRYFAGRYPNEIAGMVYVDATDLTVTRAEKLAIFEEAGLGKEEWQAMRTFWEQMLAHAPPHIAPEAEVLLKLQYEKSIEEINLPPAPDVPTVVLIAAAPRTVLQAMTPFDKTDFVKFMKVDKRRKIQRAVEDALGSPETAVIIATYSGHIMQWDDPALVIESIRRVVFPSIIRQLREAMAANGIEGVTERYYELKQRYPSGRFHEYQLNSLGYELLRSGSVEEAIAIFELNVAEYPNASNPYDSLGEAYLAAGDTAQAIMNYRRSLELNPANRKAAAALERLESK